MIKFFYRAAFILAVVVTLVSCHRSSVEWRKLDLGLTPETTLISQDDTKEAMLTPHRVNLVFFGFTHCPDFCPFTLQRIDAAIQSGNLQNKVRLIFVSVDTKNDTPAKLKEYLAPYPYARGYIGSDKEIQAVEKLLGAYSKVEKDGIAHSLFVYVLNPQGKVVYLLSRNDSLEKLRTVVSEATRL